MHKRSVSSKTGAFRARASGVVRRSPGLGLGGVALWLVDKLECDLDPKVDAHAERARKAGETQGSKGMELE